MSHDSNSFKRPSFEGKYNVDVDIEISDTKLSEKGTLSNYLFASLFLTPTSIAQVIIGVSLVFLY